MGGQQAPVGELVAHLQSTAKPVGCLLNLVAPQEHQPEIEGGLGIVWIRFQSLAFFALLAFFAPLRETIYSSSSSPSTWRSAFCTSS